MKIFFILSKRGLAVVLAFLVISLIICSQIFSERLRFIDGSTHEKRMEYLNSLKLSVDDSSFKEKEVIIPQSFSPFYESYNDIQKSSGFDLKKHKGKEAMLFSYPLGNDKTVNLLVLKGEIIGGDISENKADGKILSLKYK